MKVNRFFSILILVTLLIGTIGVSPAWADAPILVANTNDSGPGSLRDTLAAAASGATIAFDPSLSGATINLASTIAIYQNVSIDGSALAVPLTISGDSDNNGSADVSLFTVNSGYTVSITGLNLVKGATDYDGGAIEIDGGALTVNRVTFSGNTAYDGGAIDNYYGTLTVIDSTFTGNSAAKFGGAIENNSIVTVRNSTFASNTAGDSGGAIENYGSGDVTIVNSTFYNNSAVSWGGGIENGGALSVFQSTFSANSGPSGGGGIDHWDGTLVLVNTILANSPSGGDCLSSATISANLGNLVENGGCSVTLTGDPSLGALADNGGPTQTMGLLTGSKALNAADDAACTGDPVNGLDQRGITRPQDAHCDIGAYEYIPPVKQTRTLRSAAALDGWVLESGETTNLGGSINASLGAIRLGDDAAKKQYRAILSFATGAALPDNAIITKVTLKVKQQGVTPAGSQPVAIFQGFMLEIKKGYFGASNALANEDFKAIFTKSLGPIQPAPVNGWYSFDLTKVKSSLNKLATGGGLTQIRLRFKLDDNNDKIANFLTLYSGNAPLASRPQLIVEYYVP